MSILIVQNIIILNSWPRATKKAVFLTKDKSHLLDKGKLEIINFRKEMQKMSNI